MKPQLPQILLKGIIGGAFAGFLFGAYVAVLYKGHVIQRDDFNSPLAFEQAEQRYVSTTLLAFVSVFAGVGPFIAAGSFGPWVRHAVYGLVASVALVVVATLVAAGIANQQPFNMYKGSKSEWIDLGRVYLVPGALIAGPVAGLLIGPLLRRSGTNSSTISPPRPAAGE